jgi:GxxExxY protein
MLEPDLSKRIISLAIDVHRDTGPGLLESAYERCSCHEFEQADIPFARQVSVPIAY